MIRFQAYTIPFKPHKENLRTSGPKGCRPYSLLPAVCGQSSLCQYLQPAENSQPRHCWGDSLIKLALAKLILKLEFAKSVIAIGRSSSHHFLSDAQIATLLDKRFAINCLRATVDRRVRLSKASRENNGERSYVPRGLPGPKTPAAEAQRRHYLTHWP